MKTIETKVYEFDELSDAAKEKAREWYREGALDYEWWDGVFESAKTAGACLGITVDNIYFSGFWSQGDGACFVGSYAYRKGWRAALQAEFSYEGTIEPTLETIGQALQDAQRPAFYKVTASVVKGDHRYNHENTVRIECEPYAVEIDDDVSAALRDFMRWIYRALEGEYTRLNSDEQVDEAIEANEYTFTADGERFG